jgi:DNA polymerase-3 subunit alpha
MISRFSPHNHTEYSNIRLLDATNKLENLVKRGIEIGLAGLAITDHESLAGSVKICKLQEKYPDFKIAIGNEIYLTDTREKNQKYYHFILIAKEAEGHRQLRELSSLAWVNGYMDRGLMRVPTLKEDLEKVVRANPGHLIATTACIGGELSQNILIAHDAKKVKDEHTLLAASTRLDDFVSWCLRIFENDFYLEIAPGASKEQIIVNAKILEYGKVKKIPVVIGDDAHYLKKEDRFVHKAYLNSADGEREVDAFYQYAYLHNEEDCLRDLMPTCEALNLIWDITIEQLYKKLCDNSIDMFNKIETYSLLHNQTIPSVEVKDYPKANEFYPQYQITRKEVISENYPILSNMLKSDDKYDRYWINQCLEKLRDKGLYKKEYLSRLEEEADVKKTISEKLGTNIFKYPIVLQHYIDMMWDCGSLVGAGRGSSCSGLNHYLLGVTQLDPIKWNLPFFRYINKERIELPDIDLDLCPSKRPLIMKKIKAERGQKFDVNMPEELRSELGATFVTTFGTETAKSAIQTACRGYRSEQYPDGIDSDIGTYLASLVPVERGFNWTVEEMVNGNPDKGRQPVALFNAEVAQYPGLLETILGIEGLVKSRGIHASGVILFDEDPFKFGCFMRAPNGEVTTQYDLHDCEAAGMTKYDFLVTSVQDMLMQTIQFLQDDGELPQDWTLREIYDEYLHPEVLDIKDKKTWDNIKNGRILSCFQFDSDIGSQGIKKVQPNDILELSNTNGLIRLMAPDGEENPMDKYVRFKTNPGQWDIEMQTYGLTDEEQDAFRKYLKVSFGVGISQEQLMKSLMDPDICGFGLKDANAARKIIGKKQMSKIPELRAKIKEQAKSDAVGRYVWDAVARPQLGYSFSDIHALAYSFIGYQTAYIASKWNPIYWDTAVLVVNSGSLEEAEIYDDDIEDVEIKEKNTDYTKVAKAIGEIIDHHIKISLIDINRSDYGFKPDVKNNQILYGLKALSGVNTEIINEIKKNRPYKNIIDFMNKVKVKKPAMISLIKSGAFDNYGLIEGDKDKIRYANMVYYLMKTSEPKKKLNLQNMPGLVAKRILPEKLKFEERIFNFTQHLKHHKWVDKSTNAEYYVLVPKEAYDFYVMCGQEHSEFKDEYIEVIDGVPVIKQDIWKKQIYDIYMNNVRVWLKDNQEETLKKYNEVLFMDEWNKYIKNNNLASWEMDALCFYYHDHELINMNKNKYGIDNFFDYNEEPEIESLWRGNIPIYKLFRIAGTVISKNDVRHTIALLTTEGVVPVKFNRDMYAMYKRQISELQPNGTKKVVEKGWFKRGTMLIINGFRRDDMFVAKKYAKTQGHTIYKITEINENGEIKIENERGKAN